uniref:Pyridoxal phosphate homeostasis protein n=1 Tax=Crassostrea virginica TaxID=6565 RepID=A0A8B8EYR4_CRAVI|nr:pyridoxal phosphate homeostasis protein-like [Crassostrea virginica]XP_022345144.1 pyridoxal phosphate homeostasis protein-like [Crassostrea virginica]
MIRKLTSREMSSVSSALRCVLDKIEAAADKRKKAESDPSNVPAITRLVAVSKTKPPSAVIEAYRCGQRHFGENYVNEIAKKSIDPQILEECKDIQWHFIGHLQKNKTGALVSCPNLYMVETVDCDKISNSLNKQWESRNKTGKLKVMVQVNTSLEENKSGCKEADIASVVRNILDNCPNLEFIGLMTIGSFDHDLSKGPNPDFLKLSACRDKLCQELNLDKTKVELSMGMSADFEHAIELGSTNVRVGSTIFGAREPKNPNTSDGKLDATAEGKESSEPGNKMVAATNDENLQGNMTTVVEATDDLKNMSIAT